MATRADFVRRGVGAALLIFAVDALRPAPLLWCNARIGAVPFYRRLGWRVVSDVFDVPTVGPHVRMVCGRHGVVGTRLSSGSVRLPRNLVRASTDRL